MSTLRVNTIQDASGGSANSNIPGAAKAWVRFNGTNGTITTSQNVSSVVRNSTGDYTITFSSAFANTNYIMVGSASGASGVGVYCCESLSVAPTTTVFRLQTYYGYASGSLMDAPKVAVAFIAV